MSKKLVLTDVRHHGKFLVVPVDGEVELGKDGSVLVSDEAAKHLLTIPGWIDTKAKGLANDEEEEELADEEGGEGEVESQWLDGLDLDGLTKLPLEDLNEIAEAGKIKNYKKFGKNRVALAKYIKSQLNKKKK
jgi:hypothetical protein